MDYHRGPPGTNRTGQNVINKEDFPSGLLELFKTDGLLKQLEKLVLQDVERMLKPRSTPKNIRQTLAWPLSKKDVIQTIERIQRLQQNLHFALDQSNYNLTKEIRRDGQAMKNCHGQRHASRR